MFTPAEKRSIQGPYGILITPFNEDGTVDFNGLQKNVEALCKTQITGIIPCGSTGEFIRLGLDENIAVMKAVCEAAGRKHVISGGTAPDIRTALKYVEAMQRLGQQAALVAPPYYFGYSDDQIIHFYKALGSVDFPVVAYNIPAFTTAISMPVYRRLLELDHVKALKNSNPNMKELIHQVDIKNELRPDFNVLTGCDDALLPSLAGGCVGSFTALGSMLPKSICAIYSAVENKDFAAAQSLQYKLLPLLRMADSLPFPLGYKLLAAACGFSAGYLPQDIPAKSEQDIAALSQNMKRYLAENPDLV